MDSKIQEFIDLSFNSLSTMESMVKHIPDGQKKGVMLHSIGTFKKKFYDIINRHNLLPDSDNETEVLEIDIPEEENEQINFVREKASGDEIPAYIQKGGEKIDSDIDIESVTNYLKKDNNNDSLMDDHKDEMVSNTDNTPKSILKNVQISENQEGGKSRETKYEKLERKLKATPAENVIRIGKRLKISPEKNKKNLTKTYAIERILKNKKLYDEALQLERFYSSIKSETSSEN